MINHTKHMEEALLSRFMNKDCRDMNKFAYHYYIGIVHFYFFFNDYDIFSCFYALFFFLIVINRSSRFRFVDL